MSDGDDEDPRERDPIYECCDHGHELEHMRASALELSGPVDGDYGLVRPGGAAPADRDDEVVA